jgi:replicative DNA helicase
MRLLSSQSQIDSWKLRTGKRLDSREWQNLTTAATRLQQARIFIDDSPGVSALEVRAKGRRLAAEHDLSLVIVDYLQLMRGQGRTESREREISEISRSLKALAKDLRVPVVALSQLNREVEKREDKRPQMGDLRESGAIEQDADVIMFIYRDEVYRPNTDEPGIAEILIRKHRNGPTGVVKLAFDNKTTRFENYSRREES